MKEMFQTFELGNLKLANRFVFPPIKTAYGTPKGDVTDRHLTFYRQIAQDGPGLLILEPVSVTAEGREHPKQLCIHLPESAGELKKIVDVIHGQQRMACLHLNHAGAAANPKATGLQPKAPSTVNCPTTGAMADPLMDGEIRSIIDGYRSAAEKAVAAGFDAIEIQCGHGYLVSQFLNGKINKRTCKYGQNRLKFVEDVIAAVRNGAADLPILVRISGNEMSPEFGIGSEDLAPLLKLAEDKGICAVHVGMGSACFNPPWYFHHGSLPEKPQMDALSWVRGQTRLPVIAAGRMGRSERIQTVMDSDLADMIALGRPLLSDPDLIGKWQQQKADEIKYCGYCLQGCLHRVKNGKPVGCNLNPEIGRPALEQTATPLKVLVAGGGPAGMSAAVYLSKRGHHVTLCERDGRLGGQFCLAWQAPGKQKMQDGLDSLEYCLMAHSDSVVTGKAVDAALLDEIAPDLLVWATGAVQNIPAIEGLEDAYTMTSLEYFSGKKEVKGPRILVIGAGRTGLEIAEKLGKEGLDVVATKRTDPIGSMMEMISKKLTLMRIDQMPNVTIMPHTAVIRLSENSVTVEKEGETIDLEPFGTVILASGMLPAPGPEAGTGRAVPKVEIIGDAEKVMDIYTAVHAGYELARKY